MAEKVGTCSFEGLSGDGGRRDFEPLPRHFVPSKLMPSKTATYAKKQTRWTVFDVVQVDIF
jgi:hypothetical protein